MRYRDLFLAFFLTVGIPAGAVALEVTNVRAEQRAGTKLVDITYDLKTDDGKPVSISVSISDDGGATFNVKAQTLSGDVGPNVSPGTGKRIVWDAGKDWPNVSGARFLAKVIAIAGKVPVNGRIWFLSPKTPGGRDDEIWSMESDGSDARKEVELSFGSRYGSFAISPDTTEIVFVHIENSPKLKIRKVSGGLASEVFAPSYEPVNLTWSPDGNKITFVIPSEGSINSPNDQLVILDARSFSVLFNSRLPQQKDFDTQQVEKIQNLVETTWSPDGSQIFITG